MTAAAQSSLVAGALGTAAPAVPVTDAVEHSKCKVLYPIYPTPYVCSLTHT